MKRFILVDTIARPQLVVDESDEVAALVEVQARYCATYEAAAVATGVDNVHTSDTVCILKADRVSVTRSSKS